LCDDIATAMSDVEAGQVARAGLLLAEAPGAHPAASPAAVSADRGLLSTGMSVLSTGGSQSADFTAALARASSACLPGGVVVVPISVNGAPGPPGTNNGPRTYFGPNG
jgi:hypothetical protein